MAENTARLPRKKAGFPMLDAVPTRIQRSRIKGWRLPPNTVCVTRPSKWGNPFTIRKRRGKFEVLSTLQSDIDIEGCCCVVVAVCSTREDAAIEAVGLFSIAALCEELQVHPWEIREQLRGKNLACWCPIGSPCHADVLLEIANSEEPHA